MCKADSRDPGVEGGSVWYQVEWVEVCLGTLFCHEIQLGALAGLRAEENRGIIFYISEQIIVSESTTDHRDIQGGTLHVIKNSF